MIIEKVKSEGLAHLSYVICSNGDAAVIDPRRDIDIYHTIAAEQGCRITHIFETHRNEDLISGASLLADATGAKVYHGPNAAGPVVYASTTNEGESFNLGKVSLRVLETPGHTDDSISVAVYDTDFGEQALAVFTGDALFVGDVGRTDFYPERASEVAGLLFDSLQKLLSLGDQCVLYPAHGAGSVCGSGMADREISTIGYERLTNSRLQIRDRDKFIEEKLAEHHLKPPYFKTMEALNLSGEAPAPSTMMPTPLSSEQFIEMQATSIVIDVRSVSAFLGAHVPRSISLPIDMISSFAGWLLEPSDTLLLVADNAHEAQKAAQHFARIGYDNIQGFLTPSLVKWAAGGESFDTLPVVNVKTVQGRLKENLKNWVLLDVRDEEEVSETSIPEAKHIYAGELQSKLSELDDDYQYTVMCGSGTRATIAASVLKRANFSNVDLYLGSMGAHKNQTN